ncbi:MAG: hypothetical protein OSA48_07110, partial [Akkermansiaceae bacterium]|nr:hypothetical protein [Akkermansiaceae bacterium]
PKSKFLAANKIYNGLRILESVFVADSRFVNDFDRAPECPVALLENGGILSHGHNLVIISDDM